MIINNQECFISCHVLNLNFQRNYVLKNFEPINQVQNRKWLCFRWVQVKFWVTVISFHGTGKVTLWQPSICHKNINNGTWLDHADFSSILENFGNSKIFRSVQNCDREWTEMIADDHVLNVEMPRFPNLFNISIFWHGSNANRSSLRYSYWIVNPVWNQITEKIFLLVSSRFNPSDC